MSGENQVLQVDDACFRWTADGPDVLQRISFTIGRSERVALLGVSGVGKTTLARLIVGLLRPTAGRIELGPSASGGSPVDIAFQSNPLLPWLDVAANVAFGAERGGRETRAAAQEILREVGLPDAGHLRPADLSGGMRQRVAVARAILRRCQLTILDEPFSALDLLTREALYALIGRTSAAYAIAYLIVTHLPEDAYRACTRCLVLNQGGRGLDAFDIGDFGSFEDFRSAVLHSLAKPYPTAAGG